MKIVICILEVNVDYFGMLQFIKLLYNAVHLVLHFFVGIHLFETFFCFMSLPKTLNVIFNDWVCDVICLKCF